MPNVSYMNITLQLELFAHKKPNRVHISDSGRKRVLGLDQRDSEKALLFALEALVNINRIILRRNKLPPLYKSGVRYEREDTEIWRDASIVFDEKFGDCEDLAAWRVAELRNNGKRASCYLTYRNLDGMIIYHVRVLRANGKIEDPSLKLGMKGIDGF